MSKLDLNLIFSRNKKVYSIAAKNYNEKFKQRLSFNRAIARNFVKELRKTSLKKKLNILDIGCAVGIDSYCLVEEGCKITGLDISSSMISKARKNVPRTKFIIGNFWDYDFSEKFDGIYAQNFIHLFPREAAEKMILKMAKLLKKNGLIHLTTSEEGQSREGFFKKKGYRGSLLRYRKFWEVEEFKQMILGLGLKICRFYKTSSFEHFPWMVAEAGKK